MLPSHLMAGERGVQHYCFLCAVYSVSVADIIFFNMMTKLEAALLLQRFTWDYVCAMYLVLGMVCR